MAYRPPTVNRTAPKGKARVELVTQNGKHIAVVTFVDDNNAEIAPSYTIPQSGCPKYIAKGFFYVKLSQDKTKIESMSPQNGTFRFKTLKFVAKEGEEPAPYVYNNPKFHTQQEMFNVIWEIVGPKYAGMTNMVMLPYFWFDVAQEEVKGHGLQSVLALAEPKKSSKGHKVLKNYLNVSGAWDAGPIPYSDNVCPVLQKRILRAGKEFEALLENGYVSAVVVDDDTDFYTENKPAKTAPTWGDEGEVSQATNSKPAVEEGTSNWGEPESAPDFADGAHFDDEKEESGDAPWDDVGK